MIVPRTIGIVSHAGICVPPPSFPGVFVWMSAAKSAAVSAAVTVASV